MRDPVQLRVPAQLEQLAVVRAVVSTMAARQNFDLDAISDVTMAADELCSELVERAAAGATVACDFEATGDRFRIHGTVRPRTGEAQSTTSFGWRVLTALMDAADTWQDGKDLHIRAVRSR